MGDLECEKALHCGVDEDEESRTGQLNDDDDEDDEDDEMMNVDDDNECRIVEE